MAPEFKLLECQDDDVVSLRGSTYKVGDLKKLLLSHFIQSINNWGNAFINLNLGGLGNLTGCSSHFYVPVEGINCEVLRLGYAKWYKGLLRIHVTADDLGVNRRYDDNNVKVNLEFCSEETPAPPQNESPLDDICRLMKE